MPGNSIDEALARVRKDLVASDEFATESTFNECDDCMIKPGSPTLCSDCLRRRDQFGRTGKCRAPREVILLTAGLARLWTRYFFRGEGGSLPPHVLNFENSFRGVTETQAQFHERVALVIRSIRDDVANDGRFVRRLQLPTPPPTFDRVVNNVETRQVDHIRDASGAIVASLPGAIESRTVIGMDLAVGPDRTAIVPMQVSRIFPMQPADPPSPLLDQFGHAIPARPPERMHREQARVHNFHVMYGSGPAVPTPLRNHPNIFQQAEDRVDARLQEQRDWDEQHRGEFHTLDHSQFQRQLLELPGGPTVRQQMMQEELAALRAGVATNYSNLTQAMGRMRRRPAQEAILDNSHRVAMGLNPLPYQPVAIPEEVARYEREFQEAAGIVREGGAAISMHSAYLEDHAIQQRTNSINSIRQEEDERILAQVVAEAGRDPDYQLTREFDIRSVRPQGAPIEPPLQLSYSRWDNLAERQVFADGRFSFGPIALERVIATLPEEQQRASLQAATLQAAWGQAFPGEPMPEAVEDLSYTQRSRLLEELAMIGEAALSPSLIAQLPADVHSLISGGLADAVGVLQERLFLTGSTLTPAEVAARLETALVGRLQAVAPTMGTEPRTGIPSGLREYLVRRPKQLAAWERLHGTLPDTPDRYSRVLDDED